MRVNIAFVCIRTNPKYGIESTSKFLCGKLASQYLVSSTCFVNEADFNVNLYMSIHGIIVYRNMERKGKRTCNSVKTLTEDQHWQVQFVFTYS